MCAVRLASATKGGDTGGNQYAKWLCLKTGNAITQPEAAYRAGLWSANLLSTPAPRYGGTTILANSRYMEDIAKTATPVNDLGQLNPYHVDAALLH